MLTEQANINEFMQHIFQYFGIQHTNNIMRLCCEWAIKSIIISNPQLNSKFDKLFICGRSKSRKCALDVVKTWNKNDRKHRDQVTLTCQRIFSNRNPIVVNVKPTRKLSTNDFWALKIENCPEKKLNTQTIYFAIES